MTASSQTGKTVVLIAGMHRSGTSALTRVISLMGGGLPRKVLQPNAANTKGFWESPAVNRLNDAVLASAGLSWRSWEPIDDGWQRSQVVDSFGDEAAALLREEFGPSAMPVLKDPRICRLIPFWRCVTERIGGRPVAILPLRNPLEVSESLYKRNRLDRSLGHIIWLRYVLDAESRTRDLPRSIISFDGLLHSWRESVERMGRDLDVEWPVPIENAEAHIKAFLSTEDRHHVKSAESVESNHDLPEWLTTAFAITRRWTETGEDRSDFAELDRIRSEFDAAAPAFSRLLTSGLQAATKLRKLKNETGEESANGPAGDGATGTVDADANAADPAAVADAPSEEKTRALEAQVKALSRQIDHAEAELADFAAKRFADTSRIGALDRQLREALRQFAVRDLEARQMEAKLTALTESATKTESGLKRERANLSAIETSLARARADLAAERGVREKAETDRDRLSAELQRIHGSRGWAVAQSLTRVARAARRLSPLRQSANDPGDALELLQGSDLFDAEWYLSQNPDVAADGGDPARHYLSFGASEGRDPGPRFSTGRYLEMYPDVAENGGNPLVHYLRFGRAEGRQISATTTLGVPAEAKVEAKPDRLQEPPVEAAVPPAPAVANEDEIDWTRRRDLRVGADDTGLSFSGMLLGKAPARVAETAHSALSDCLRAVSTYCRLIGGDPAELVSLRVGDDDATARPHEEPHSRRPASGDLPFGEAWPLLRIADIWFLNDRDIRIRLDTTPKSTENGVVRFYQWTLHPEGALDMVAEAPLAKAAPGFVDLQLANPFVPVLIVVSDPQGNLRDASVIPFPSLCRGGFHYAELCATGAEPSYTENLRAVSQRLMADFLDDAGTGLPLSLGRIEVDIDGANGSEPIFSEDVKEWLGGILQVKPTAVPANDDDGVRSFLEESLALPPHIAISSLGKRIEEREKAARFSLTLAADSLPSLQALMSRNLPSSGQRRLIGSFVIADRLTTEPKWSISMPPLGDELIDAQPTGAAITYPFLTSTGDLADGDGEGTVPVLAVRFSDDRFQNDASLMLPVAPDARGPLLRTKPQSAQRRRISVVVPSCDPQGAAFATLLRSLSLQSGPIRMDVIVLSASQVPEERAALGALLGKFFPQRYTIVGCDETSSHNERINLGCRSAGGDFLLVASENVVLHDARTIDTLSLLASGPRIASAGCVHVLEKKDRRGRKELAGFGGIFPVQPSSAAAELRFAGQDCRSTLPSATYPVAANPSTLMMVRAEAWHSLGGLDTTNFSDRHGDVDFGIRAIGTGRINLCTSVVSIEDRTVDLTATYDNCTLPFSLTVEMRGRVARSAAILGALRG